MPWLITPANGSPPDGLMCIVWIGQTPLFHEMRDECVLIRSCAPCTTLIIIFIDEYLRRQDDKVAICVQRLSHANMEQGLCHWWEIWSCTELRPLCLSNLHTHTAPLSNHRSEYTKAIFYIPIYAILCVSQTCSHIVVALYGNILCTDLNALSALHPDWRYEQQPLSTHRPAFWDMVLFLSG